MDHPQTFSHFLALLALSAVLGVVGIALLFRLVPPNRLCGWRSKAALEDPEIWYPVNQVAGFCVLLTGLLLAAVSAWTYSAEMASYPASCLSGAAFFFGMIAMAIHGGITERRLTPAAAKTGWWIIALLSLVFLGLLLSGLTLGMLR